MELPTADIRAVKLEMKRCNKCGAPLIIGFEHKNMPCCTKGKRVLSQESWPVFPEDYKELLRQHEVLLHDSSMINGRLSLARIGFLGATDREAGFRYEGSRQSSVTILQGRVYHQMKNGIGQFYGTLTQRAPVENTQSLRAEEQLGRYLLQNHRFLNQCGDPRAVWDTVRRDATKVCLVIDNRDAPTANDQAAIGRAPETGALHLPVIDYVGAGHNFHRNDGIDALVFPLLLPQGQGGYDSRAHTPLQFYKSVVYQRAVDLALLPRLAETLVLDAFSRSQQHLFEGAMRCEGKRRSVVQKVVVSSSELNFFCFFFLNDLRRLRCPRRDPQITRAGVRAHELKIVAALAHIEMMRRSVGA